MTDETKIGVYAFNKQSRLQKIGRTQTHKLNRTRETPAIAGL